MKFGKRPRVYPREKRPQPYWTIVECNLHVSGQPVGCLAALELGWLARTWAVTGLSSWDGEYSPTMDAIRRRGGAGEYDETRER